MVLKLPKPGIHVYMNILRDGVEEKRMVAPPIYNLLQTYVVDNKKCEYCLIHGKHCYHRRFGRFCVAIVYRYYRWNRESYNEVQATKRFMNAFFYALDYELYCSNPGHSIKSEDRIKLPGCLECCDIIYALNVFDREKMIYEVHKSAGFW